MILEDFCCDIDLLFFIARPLLIVPSQLESVKHCTFIQDSIGMIHCHDIMQSSSPTVAFQVWFDLQ